MKQELAKGYNNFRSKYGDYFIYSITYKAKFTAVWKCMANLSSEINAFHASVNANVSAQSQLKGSGGFETTLQSAAKQYNISVDIKYSTVSNAGKTNFNTGDPVNTLKNFQKVCQPAPATVLLRHYSQVNMDIPATIDVPPSVYTALSEVFSQANYLLLLNGLASGNATTRMQRCQNLNDLIKSIHTARSTFDKNPGALKNSLSSLMAFRAKLLLLLERQDLVAEQVGLTNADLIKMFPFDHQDADGTWVKSASGHHSYVFGKFTFTPEDTKKYVIKIIPPENPLGTKAFKILVKSEGSRGMDWGLAVAYIQTSDYDGST